MRLSSKRLAAPCGLSLPMAFLLASCSGEQARMAPPPQPRATTSIGGAATIVDEPVKLGDPYQVGGVTYTPVDAQAYDEVGYASWYGEEAIGNVTANGEAFVAGAITAAHRTLPLPSYVEVTALDSGRTILVRINDRGPFAGNKIIDLSRGAAEQLGITGDGAAAVRVRRVNPPEPEKALLRSHARAPERISTPSAVLNGLRGRLGEKGQARAIPVAMAQARPAAAVPAPRISAPPASSDRPGASFDIPVAPIRKPEAAAPSSAPKAQGQHAASGGYVVQVVALSSRTRAETLARQLGASVVPAGNLWRVRYGPYPTQGAAAAGVRAAAAKGYQNVRIMANDAR